MYVVGTAGHVDHGKSTLVHALTGIDPDRLREEKERGLTIELGFAWLELPSGREVSIVDVPGHERFIKNMLAGAGGVDLALLVVAADEGVMPQTREHLAILDLLDVPAGIVALTKCDLVEEEYAGLVEADVADVLAGTRLAGAPIVRTSAATRAGLDGLRATIDDALERTPAKRDLGRPRLPIDRAFTIQGFGTVVTGTLLDGSLEIGQEVQLQPGGLRGRIRGLQRHRTKVQRLEPGTRAAVNISGLKTEDIERGMVLALPGNLKPVRVVDVRLTAPRILSHPLAHDAGVTLLSATAESEAKLRLLDANAIGPGESCWGQIVLETPIAVLPRDHCIVRTPNETAAGGVIVAVNARRHRRNDAATLPQLERLLAGSPEERLIDLLASRPLAVGAIATSLGIEPAEAAKVTAEAAARALVVELGGMLASGAWMNQATSRIEGATSNYLDLHPLRMAVPREHIRSTAGIDATVFDAIVAYACSMGAIEERGAGLATPGWEPRLTPAQEAEAERFLRTIGEGGYSPPTEGMPGDELLAYLTERGLIENTGRGVVFDREVYGEMVAKVVRHLETHPQITIAEVRDLFGTSRKYAQALLEHLDATKVTRRSGDAHVLRAGVEARR
ncbi:MAG: selenocysteine-specific translation elongation factor [Dehalococcoidia bacterium]